MKTSITFNKVINDAGQLALTEGHTVLTSSPRVTPCGLLSFKGVIMKTKKEIEKKLAEETAKEKKLATDQDAEAWEVESQLATVDTLRWVLGFCG